ncbi:MAG TPA: PIN domain-containing protein [Terriglobia bacterium]|nr:PIN domain-containing protein [Terriglobia bacterium]
MKPVFADSVYFFALLNARDRIHERAKHYAAQATLPILTTAWVLTEVADGLCDRASRHAVVRLWQTLQSASDAEIVLPSPELFHRGFERYRLRPDKDWSLTDCFSFVVMEERGLTEALTADRHFQQAGFATLLG